MADPRDPDPTPVDEDELHDAATEDDTDEPSEAGGGGGGGGGVGQVVRDPRDTITSEAFAGSAAGGATVDRRGAALPSDEVTAELVVAEMALAILEDESTVRLDGDALLDYDELRPDDVAAELVAAQAIAVDDSARIEANWFAWYVRGWQLQMDHDFDYATSGNPLPDRTIALRGAITAAISRVGGIRAPTVGGYVWALRQSRTTLAEPYIDEWMRAGQVPEDLGAVLPPPDDSRAWRRAAEAAIVLRATGALSGGRSNQYVVLAVGSSLATLNDARRDMGLPMLRLSELERTARRTLGHEPGQAFDLERDITPGSPG